MTEPSRPRPVPGPPRPGPRPAPVPGPPAPAGATVPAPVTGPPAAQPGPGGPAVEDAGTGVFADLAERPLAEHVAVFEAEHARLQRELATIDQL
ncbi:hypothetical protein [Geodermatophilus sp. SYSU D00079]